MRLINVDKLPFTEPQNSDYKCGWNDALWAVKEMPTIDAVSRAVYDQTAWERDIAIGQLADIGKSFGEKMDDVAKVVRCRECIYYNTDDCDDGFGWCNYSILDTRVPDDWYCAGAAQREDGDT